MKRILIDGTTISRRIDGLTQYILNVVLHLDSEKNQYTLLVRPHECPEDYRLQFLAKGISIEEADIAPIGPKRDIQFASYMRRHTCYDAAFIPSNQYPIALHLPAIYVVHDLIYEEFPEQLGRMNRLKRWYLRMVVKVGLQRAQHVVAVSNYTRGEIIRCHGNRYGGNIHVIYEGWEHLLNQNLDKRKASIQIDFQDYILYVGSSRGHKNLSRLIAAVKQCYHHLPEGTGIVIVGNTNMFTPVQIREIEELNRSKKMIQLTGWLSGEALVEYFRNAKGLIFPSLSEGFGIPILEAYYYKIPLLLSNQASLPEVAGDAAIYFNPYSIEDIANTIVQFVREKDHGDLIRRQSVRLQQYSWKKTSSEIEQLIESLKIPCQGK